MILKCGRMYHIYFHEAFEQLVLVKKFNYATSPHDPGIEPVSIKISVLAGDYDLTPWDDTLEYSVDLDYIKRHFKKIIEVFKEDLPLYISWKFTMPKLASLIKNV